MNEPSKELQDKVDEIVNIVKNFRIVGPGISGSFEEGYKLNYESTETPQ